MSDLIKIVALMKDKLPGINVYSGEIPESESEPSILVASIAYPFKRTVEGRKVRKHSVWRITVVAELQSSVESVMKLLDKMDNTNTVDFQQIWTALVNDEQGQNEQPYRRAFYDVTVYNR